MTQRAVAASIGIHPTHLCGIERGRRQISHPGVLEQLARALTLSADDLKGFRWALAHDQVIEGARTAGLSEAALALLSIFLELEHELDQDELAGIQRLMVTALQSKRVLSSYAGRSLLAKEGVIMS